MKLQNNWLDKPVLVMRRDYVGAFEKFVNSDLEQKARETREKWGCNTEWVMGSLGCAPGLAHLTTFDGEGLEKLDALGRHDLLREYVPRAHAAGIKIIAYLNMHWFSYAFAEEHPDWEQRLADGTAYGRKHPLYGNGTTMCVNTPWREFAFRMIAEAAKTGIDGIFLDGPVVFPGACRCRSCRQIFESEHGSPVPEKEDWTDPVWKRFVLFREQSMVRFLRDARKALHRENPDAIIYLNSGRWRSSEVARSSLMLESCQDITGAEEFFHPGPKQHHLFATFLTAKFLSAGENPAMVFTHHTLGAWHYLPLPAKEMQLAIAQTVAGGANPWFAFFYLSEENHSAESLEGVAGIQQFITRNERVFVNTESGANIAVWISEQTFRFYLSEQAAIYSEGGSGDEENLIADLGEKRSETMKARKRFCADRMENEIKGFTDILVRNHLPYDVLWDNHLNESRLSGYRVLILPNCACIAEEQRTAIKDFVKTGGLLIADFETGFYDEYGNASDGTGWRQFLGIEELQGCFAPSLVEDYVSVMSESPLIGGFVSGQRAPRPELCLRTIADPTAEVPLRIMNPVGRSYKELDGISAFSALHTVNRGLGRVAYYSGLIGDFYFQRKMPAWERILCGTVESADPRPFKIEAPAGVIAELRIGSDGSRFIHLVNCCSDGQRPIQEFIPIHDIEITLPLMGSGEKPAARSLRQRQDLPVIPGSDSISIRLPYLEQYDIIALEIALEIAMEQTDAE